MDYIGYAPEKEITMNEKDESEMDIDTISLQFGQIERIVDFDTMQDSMQQTQDEAMEEAVEKLSVKFETLSTTEQKKYLKYDENAVLRLISIKREQGLSTPKAAALCGIPRSSAYELIKNYNRGNGSVAPSIGRTSVASKPKKLFPEHTAFLIKFFDENPSSTLAMARAALAENFEGLEVSVVGLWKHITGKCSLTLKNASKYTLERDAPRTIQLRFDIVTEWKAAGVDFRKNCVFIDEAGFNTHLMRSRGWAPRGEPASVKLHTQRGVNLNLLGCICARGYLDFSTVVPIKSSEAQQIEKEFHQQEAPKKRKRTTDETKPKKIAKGTTAYHIVRFVEAVMDTMDKHSMKGFFIVMDNCRIHHSKFVVDAINNRGYKPLFMPPYSPFLNPIEECWAKIKSNIRRNPLQEGDELSARVKEACKTVTPDDCLGWVKHAEKYWDRCLDKEVGLK